MRERDLVMNQTVGVVLLGDADVRSRLCMRLRNKGYDCEPVSRGEELATLDAELVITNDDALCDRLQGWAGERGRRLEIMTLSSSLGSIDDLERAVVAKLTSYDEALV